MDKLAKVDSAQLEEVVNNSGLAIQEGEEIKQSYIPFLVQLAEIQDQASKINFESPTRLDEEIAGKLRKATVKIRTGASDLKESRKRIHLLKGNLEQAAYNLIAASCKLAEETFVTVEKAREIAETKRQAELKTVRDAEILPLIEFVPAGLDMGKMTEEDYQKLLSGAKMQMDAKIEAEKKAEAERIVAEQARIAEEKRIRDENERLKKEAEEKEKQLEAERAKVEQERKLAEETARKEREALEAKADEERKKAAEIARIEKEKADAALKAEQDAKAKLEAELKAKADAEETARKDAELSAKKAAAAPDRDKLLALAVQISTMKLPELKTPEAKAILANVETLIAKTAAYINEKSATL